MRSPGLCRSGLQVITLVPHQVLPSVQPVPALPGGRGMCGAPTLPALKKHRTVPDDAGDLQAPIVTAVV